MGKKTHVFPFHQKYGNIVEFAGYDLPIWYEGIVAECRTVREHAGIFDVSHMGRVTVEGPGSARFLDGLTTNNISKLKVNEGQYSLFCNSQGGIIDDLTVFRLGESKYLVVYNAGNREKDWDWLMKGLGEDKQVKISDVSDKVAMFAVQGPMASGLLHTITRVDLEDVDRYWAVEANVDGNISCLVTRTGYTGEDGFEIYVWNTPVSDPAKALKVWNGMVENGRSLGAHPAGLGARDVLRLEAGMCLYGNDIDEKTTPVDAKLMFVTDLNKGQFVGREAIIREKQAGPGRVRIGFKVTGRGIPRKGQAIRSGSAAVGIVTSGTLSPTLGDSIGMGFVPPGYASIGSTIDINIRDRDVPATIMKLPFYQRRSGERVIAYGREMGLMEFRTSHSASAEGQARVQ